MTNFYFRGSFVAECQVLRLIFRKISPKIMFVPKKLNQKHNLYPIFRF